MDYLSIPKNMNPWDIFALNYQNIEDNMCDQHYMGKNK